MKDGATGLTSAEAEARLRRHGPNVLRPKKRRALVVELLARFRNPLVLSLFGSAIVSTLLGEARSAIVVAVIVAMSVTLDFVQEHRAARAAEALRRAVETRATVRRDGVVVDVPASTVVPGDVVLLRAGDLVPADARVIEAHDLFVNQAMLTGEAYPVEKEAGEEAEGVELENPPPTSPGHVFMGSSVVSGSATVVVRRTGAKTAVGETARLVEAKPPASDFQRGTREFGLMIARVTAFLVLFVVVVNVALDRPLFDSLLFAVALAVGLTPELLPMIVSVTLARGALRMAEKKVIVKRLAAVQNLGSMDVLCTDKTGTLTEAHIRLEKHVDRRGVEDEDVLALAYLNSVFETGVRSPLDEAILAHEKDDPGVGPKGPPHLHAKRFRKIDEVPFDFERRRVSVLVDDGARRLLVVKGSFEDVLRISATCDGGATVLDDARRREIREVAESLGREGYRVVAIASREVPRTHPHAVPSDEAALDFAGFCAFLDPPKASAGEALRALGSRGVRVKIVTGDDELVARHVCRELGIAAPQVLTGDEILRLDDHALRVRVEEADLFCRVTPAQKTRVLLALKARGHVVGFMGDGINDAPSLHAADVGISVDGAVDVAKEAADLILLEHDLRVLYDGVIEGRRTFGNVMKYVMMGTSSNFGNMFSMAAASAFLPFLPLLPIQILLNNLLYDVSEIPIPLDGVDEEMLARPHRWDVGFVKRFMVTVGPVSSVFDLLTFGALLGIVHASAPAFRAGWFVESLASQVLVIFVIRTRGSPFSSRPSRSLIVAVLAVLSIALFLPASPFATWLGFAPVPLPFVPILVAILAGYLCTVELVKRRFYRRFAPFA